MFLRVASRASWCEWFSKKKKTPFVTPCPQLLTQWRLPIKQGCNSFHIESAEIIAHQWRSRSVVSVDMLWWCPLEANVTFCTPLEWQETSVKDTAWRWFWTAVWDIFGNAGRTVNAPLQGRVRIPVSCSFRFWCASSAQCASEVLTHCSLPQGNHLLAALLIS